MSRLTIVPTPIGNLKDITLRALEVLRDSDLILAEDTRTTSILLAKYDIKRPMQSHHKYNEHTTSLALAKRIQAGENFALVSDAGTPGLSDPGFMLVRDCINLGVTVECLPGATAAIPALIASGMPADRFVFEGFLPLKKGLETRLNELAEEERTIILYESPHRLEKTLARLKKHFGDDRVAAVCRELTKLHEEIRRGSLAELHEYYATNTPRGEIVIIINGKPSKKQLRKQKQESESKNICKG